MLQNKKEPIVLLNVLCCVQSCPNLCDPMDSSPPGSSVPEDAPGKNTGEGCHAPLQGIFPTQGTDLGLLHCRQILYCLSHQGSPCYLINMIKIKVKMRWILS